MNKGRLDAKIRERNLTISEIAHELGINPSTYYRKVNADGETFTVAEIKRLAQFLQIPSAEAQEIFLQ